MRLDRYEVVEELGTGAYGRVYRVRDEEGNELAAKRVVVEDDRLPLGLLREVAVGMCCYHPNLTGFSEVRFLEEEVLVLMECATTTLSTVWRKEFQGVKHIIRSLLSGLEFLHRYHLIHGDVKPANVLLFETGDVKLCDYGLTVRSYGQPLSSNVQSIWWRAPEVLRSEKYDGRIDVWSVGVILYQLLVKQYLFTEMDDVAMLRLLTADLEGRLTVLPDVPLAPLCRSLLTFDPQKRPTALEALRLLDGAETKDTVGTWLVLSKRQKVEQSARLLRRLRSPITYKLALRILQRCRGRDDVHVEGCAQIAHQLVTGEELDGYEEATDAIRLVCTETQCSFYS